MNHTKQWVWKSSVEGKHFKHIVSISTCRCGTHGLLFFLFLYFFCFHFLVAIHRLFPHCASFFRSPPEENLCRRSQKNATGISKRCVGCVYVVCSFWCGVRSSSRRERRRAKEKGTNDGKLRLADGKVCWDRGVKVLLLELYLNTC